MPERLTAGRGTELQPGGEPETQDFTTKGGGNSLFIPRENKPS